MKIKHLFFITLIFTTTFFSNGFAQDYTQIGLPEGATARLGKGGINIIRFSPDGTKLAVGTHVGLWLYDVPDAKETALFTGLTGFVNAIVFSPDGTMLASTGVANPIIQIWDPNTGEKLKGITIEDRGGRSITTLEFSKDSETLVGISMFGEITRWDIKTGNPLTQAKRASLLRSGHVIVPALHNNIFASGHRDGKIYLWDVTTGKSRGSIRGHAGILKRDDKDIWALAFSPTEQVLASGSADKSVRLWNTDNRKNLAKLGVHDAWVTALAFSADGKTLASGDANKTIKLWDIESQAEFATLIGHSHGISTLAFSPDGKILASGSYDGTIRFWDQDTGKEISTFAAGYTNEIKALAFSENDTTLASAAATGTVDVWSLRTHSELITLTDEKNKMFDSVVFSQDAKMFAAKSQFQTVAFLPFGQHAEGHNIPNSLQIRDIATDQILQGPWIDNVNLINGFVFSPDNKMFVASLRQQGIVAWNINTAEEMFRYNDANRESFDGKLVYSLDGNMLARYGMHTKTYIWNTTTQEQITPPNLGRATGLAFSDDSKSLATSSHDGIVLWDITESGIKERGEIRDSRRSDHLRFSPDGKVLVGQKSTGWEYHIQLWDVGTGSELNTLSGHTKYISVMEFSTDGKTFASGSSDGTILLWDWEKITANNLGKDLSNNIIPPIEPLKFASSTEEAAAVINWMQENGCKLKKTYRGWTLTHGGGTATVSGGSGNLRVGKVNVIITQNQNVQIKISGVGSSTFVLDDKGTLIPKTPKEENK